MNSKYFKVRKPGEMAQYNFRGLLGFCNYEILCA